MIGADVMPLEGMLLVGAPNGGHKLYPMAFLTALWA